jgi:hypothetical protein
MPTDNESKVAEQQLIDEEAISAGYSDHEELPLPSMSDRLKNLAKAGSKVVEALFEGEEILADETRVQYRRGICYQCQFYRKSDGNCSSCGCPIERKIKLATEACPEGKWMTCLTTAKVTNDQPSRRQHGAAKSGCRKCQKADPQS